MRTISEIASAYNVLVSVVNIIAERGLAFRDDENVESPRKFFAKNFQNFF